MTISTRSQTSWPGNDYTPNPSGVSLLCLQLKRFHVYGAPAWSVLKESKIAMGLFSLSRVSVAFGQYMGLA